MWCDREGRDGYLFFAFNFGLFDIQMHWYFLIQYYKTLKICSLSLLFLSLVAVLWSRFRKIVPIYFQSLVCSILSWYHFRFLFLFNFQSKGYPFYFSNGFLFMYMFKFFNFSVISLFFHFSLFSKCTLYLWIASCSSFCKSQ